jgi:hypothetical protein
LGIEVSDENNAAIKALVVYVIGVGIYVACLAWDVNPMKAFGYGWICIPVTLYHSCLPTLSPRIGKQQVLRSFPTLFGS